MLAHGEPPPPVTRSRERSIEGAAGANAPGSIQTTTNVYGQAMLLSKRKESGNPVEMVLKPLKASA